MDPFAIAAATLFGGPAAIAAVYRPAGGPPVAVQAIRGQPDEQVRFGESRIVQATNVFELLRAEVPTPAAGDQLVLGAEIVDDAIVGGEPFELYGAPMLDLEGVSWRCGAEPA